MPSYGSKLPPPLLTPASFSLRGAGLLVTAAFLVSMMLMGLVLQFVEVSSIMLVKENDSPTTLRLAAKEQTIASVSAPPLNLYTTEDEKNLDNLRVIIAFDGDHPVLPGQYVPMDEAQQAPSVCIEGHITDYSERFTYVLIDLDAPDPRAPTHAPFLHYILANLVATGKNVQDNDKIVVVPYYPVTPPVGEHRYVSLLFCQLQGPPRALDEIKRANFDVTEFATKNMLELVASSSFHSHPTPKIEE
ncbi:Phosphatidylethanolamine binding protein [Plasmopara halstedii]|uniref:Phosphatidylethanolamine binding protein n=1 Tax=Plasmopara halstedii TaxID=4781 RepID=A0A0P1AY15_PLAHL|nr:Phosphatidylethanolamine binding protein [Plasmopara halstedii]CEG46583.1 Phosphatidylethanolamine binding protein [Plasmopara halstedii]|eukprot:XP_024582952.1 Phosphatidylethanolamine binding protein [Plasmopara halstedii]